MFTAGEYVDMALYLWDKDEWANLDLGNATGDELLVLAAKAIAAGYQVR